MTSRKLSLVVAACNNRGIGVNGTLPWRLRGDMAFFKRITSETKNPELQNAVIMGRRTWESIPKAHRPLANRLNIIISRTWQESPEGSYLVRSLDEAIELCMTGVLSSKVETLFIIGGSSIYDMAFASPDCHRIYLTQVMGEFECDTFMPEFDKTVFKKVQLDGIDPEIQTENEIEYQYEVYEKVDVNPEVEACR